MHGCFSCRLLCLLAGAVVAAGGAIASGEDIQFVSTTSLADIEARLAALETAQSEAAQCGGGAAQWIDTSCQNYTLRFGGRFFADGVNFRRQNPASYAAFGNQPDYVEMRSIRLFCEGEGYGVFDYRLELDFEPENSGSEAVAIRDLYLGIRELPILGSVRIGNVKEPFSLEEQTRLENTTFMERALPNVFAPGRQFGLCCYQHTPNNRFTVAYGVFFDRAAMDHGPLTDDPRQINKQLVDDEQGIDVPIRVTWNPIYTAGGRGVLHAGAGCVWTDDRDDLVAFSALPEVHEGAAQLSTGLLAIREYYRTNLELAAVYGPFSVQSELFYTHGDAPAGFYDRDLYGAYVYGSWFLTGENRVYDQRSGSFCRVKPNTNFWIVKTCDGCCAGWGAWELAARWSYLELEGEPGIGPLEGRMYDTTVGLNWYWNPQTRVMCNYIHSEGEVNYNLREKNHTDVLAVRFQVDF